jgi:thiol-disulfide isomerase/thioredoxin
MKRRKAEIERQNALVRMIAGAGLVLVGVALYLVLRGTPASSAPAAEERSVVPAEVHYAAPALSLNNLQGASESLADYRGSVVLVNNWATWCPPCKAEMPTLESYYEQHASQGFIIIAIEAGDSPENVQPFVQSYGLQFRVWLDPKSASLNAFRNPNLPNSYVLDRDGMVRYAWTGEISRAMLEKYVTPLLGEE